MRHHVFILALAFVTMPGQILAMKASGPLRVHPTNPRYFTDDSGKAIYLTGSHAGDAVLHLKVQSPGPERRTGG